MQQKPAFSFYLGKPYFYNLEFLEYIPFPFTV